VDDWLTAHPDASERILEIDPEVCFWSINGKRPMTSPKKSAAGGEERLRLLTRWEPSAPELRLRVLAERRRSEVQSDDVLDALVAFVTLSAPPERLRRLPDMAERDALGLPMQMLYREG
jgi:threonine dehydratase